MKERLKEMIKQLQEWSKDPVKLSFGLSIVFYLAILISIYKMASLPSDLIYQGGMTSSGSEGWVLAKLFIAVGITLLLGITAIYVQQKVKKETIVYIEKTTVELASDENKNEEKGESFDLKNFKDSISKIKETSERKQQGLNLICDFLEAGQAAFYDWNGREANYSHGFAFAPESAVPAYGIGEGLVGQAATGQSIYLDELPEDYLKVIESGLGSAKPKSLFVVPLLKDGKVIAVIEFAALKLLSEDVRKEVITAGNILADNC